MPKAWRRLALTALRPPGELRAAIESNELGETRMPQIILGLIALVLAIYLAIYLLTIATISLLPVGIGWFMGASVRLSMRQSAYGLFNRAMDGIVDVTLHDTRVEYAINTAGVTTFVSNNRLKHSVPLLVSLMSTSATLLIMWKAGAYSNLRIDQTAFPDGLNVIIAAVLSLAATSFLMKWRWKSFHEEITESVEAHIAHLTERNGPLEGFALLLNHYRTARGSLQLPSTSKHEALLRQRLAIHSRDLASGKMSTEEFVKPCIDELRRDSEFVDGASNQLSEMNELYESAVTAANQTGNRAVFFMLDKLLVAIDASHALIAQEKWSAFRQCADAIKNQLRLLIGNARSLNSDGTGVSDQRDKGDPYTVLGIRRDLSNDEVRRVYQKLANIYHPDKGKALDHRRFQEIQMAWQKIAEQRGI
jgi:hypothetical protein